MLCFLLLITVPVFAQTNFKPGYIVKSAEDTLKGFLDENGERKLCAAVTFSKDTEGTDPKTFTADDIAGFGFTNGDVFSKTVFYNTADNHPDVSFAKFLLNGYYKLYTLIKSNDVRYYLVKTQQDSVYLLYDDIYTANGTLLQATNYKNVLAFLAGNCGNLRSRTDKVNYTEGDVLAYVKAVNSCISPSAANQVLYKKEVTEIHFYGYAGGITLGSPYEFTGRALAQFVFPSRSRAVAINAGVVYTGVKKDHVYHYTDQGIVSGDNVRKSTVTTSMVSIPVTLQFHIGQGKLRPYAEGGFSYIMARLTGTLDDFLAPMQPFTATGFNPIGEVGLEYNVSPNIFINANYRYEYRLYYPTIGVACRF